MQPLFHLFNGDLCYANLANDRVRTWSDFWENNSRSARNRPWMPAPGNHENELGNGPIGYQAFQTYFALPPQPGQTAITRGLWYAFTVGSVRVICLANDDVCYQDGGNSYVRGYSNGAQKAWLEQGTAGRPRQPRHRLGRRVHAPGRDQHRQSCSTAPTSASARSGCRCSTSTASTSSSAVTSTTTSVRTRSAADAAERDAHPEPASTRTDVIDTTKGTVHMVIGGGGTSAPSNGCSSTRRMPGHHRRRSARPDDR